jgi:hypothetical protein
METFPARMEGRNTFSICMGVHTCVAYVTLVIPARAGPKSKNTVQKTRVRYEWVQHRSYSLLLASRKTYHFCLSIALPLLWESVVACSPSSLWCSGWWMPKRLAMAMGLSTSA